MAVRESESESLREKERGVPEFRLGLGFGRKIIRYTHTHTHS